MRVFECEHNILEFRKHVLAVPLVRIAEPQRVPMSVRRRSGVRAGCACATGI